MLHHTPDQFDPSLVEIKFHPLEVTALRRGSTRDFRAEMRKRGSRAMRLAGDKGIYEGRLETATRLALTAFNNADQTLRASLGGAA